MEEWTQSIPQCKLCVDSDWRFGKLPSSNLTSDRHVSGNERPLANSFLNHTPPPTPKYLATARCASQTQAFEMEKYNVESYQKPSVRFRGAASSVVSHSDRPRDAVALSTYESRGGSPASLGGHFAGRGAVRKRGRRRATPPRKVYLCRRSVTPLSRILYHTIRKT